MKLLNKIALAGFLCTSSFSAFAQDNIQSQIEQLMQENQFDAAYKVAKSGYGKTNELDRLFVLAQLAKRNGRLMEAQSYYKQMLAINPELSRVKLELADVNVNLGYSSEAKQLLTDVNTENLPQNVKMNVERYLQAIDNGKYPKNSALSISWNTVYDTNVNSGPDTDTVTMFGLPFQLSTDAKENSDLGIQLSANYIHNHRINDDTSINSSLNLGYTGWSKFDKLNNLAISGRAGISQRLKPNQSVYLPIEFSKSYVDGDNHYTSYSVSPSYTYRFGKQAYATLTAVGSKREYDKNDKEADIYSGNIRTGYELTPSLNASAQFTYGTEDYNVDSDDNDFYNTNLTLSKTLSEKLSGYVGVGYSNVNYDMVSAAYGEARKDDNLNFRGGLNYALADNTSLVFNISHSKNDSNIDVNEYDRTRISLGVNGTF